ncbi:MAG TPA: hypothetical protein VIH57_22190 [Bacteroidales bacterium]
MKSTLLIAIIFCTCSFAHAQTQGQSDEVTTLKKQVVSLKQSNASLSQNVKELKKTVKILQDSLNTALKRSDQRLNTMEDTLKANVSIMKATKTHFGMIDHSLKTRKTAVYIGFVLAVILIVGFYLFVIRKFKTANEKDEARIFNVKDSLETEISKNQSDLQGQIASVKEEITAAKNDLETKIREVKKVSH